MTRKPRTYVLARLEELERAVRSSRRVADKPTALRLIEELRTLIEGGE